MLLKLSLELYHDAGAQIHRPSRFENMWHNHPGFDQLLHKWWEEEPQKTEPAHKPRHPCEKLKNWSKDFNKGRLERKKVIYSRIDRLDLREEESGLSPSEHEERCSLKAELLQDEVYWKR